MSTECSSVTLHKSCRMKPRICLSSVVMRQTRFELIGLEWTWLDSIRLDWSRLDLIGLDFTRLDFILLRSTWLHLDLTWFHSLDSVGLDSTWLDSIRIELTPFDFNGLDSNWLYSIRSYWARFYSFLYFIRHDYTRFDLILRDSTFLDSIRLMCQTPYVLIRICIWKYKQRILFEKANYW